MFVIRLISGMAVMAAGTSFAQTPPDSAVRLDPLEVTASIRGVVAGPAAASGIPARLTTLSIDRLAGFRPTLVTDALRDNIVSLEAGERGQYDVVMKSGARLLSSRRHSDRVRSLFR